jgi:hypothetical protein
VDGHDVIPEDAAYLEVTFNGVTHRVPMGLEHARRWLEGDEAIGYARGEPSVDEHGQLVEDHTGVMPEVDGEDPDDEER